MFDIKVTRIKDKFHARLYQNNQLLDEMICQLRIDIGYICREMLRWQDKLGNSNSQTKSARRRQNINIGKIYYKGKGNK